MSAPFDLSAKLPMAPAFASDLPRLGLLTFIVIAWASTLAWPLPSGDTFPRISTNDQAGQSQYPLRVALPEAKPLPTEQLDELIRSHTASGSQPLAQLVPGETALPAISDDASLVRSDTQRTIPRVSTGGVLAIDYDMTSLEPTPEKYDRSDGSLTIEKQLFVDGVSTGAATIRIENGSQILISTTSVARALGDRTEALPRRISGALAKGTGFIPFYELRGAGIDVKYDPVTDRVSLSTVS